MPPEGQYIGRYRVLRPIGSGGMGEVYLAEDSVIPRQVAIKIIRTELSSFPDASRAQEATRLFQREAQVIANLDHPHILPLLDYGEQAINGTKHTYMVMPFRPEGALSTWLSQRPGSKMLSPAAVADLVCQAADALQYAHDHGIVHQDVKPSNFLIRPRHDKPDLPGLLLTDFGVAKITSGTAGQSYNVRGTAIYMAPEQWRGYALPASDQYALAIMAYELLTGRPPFVGRMESVMYAHMNARPKEPGYLNPTIPAAVNAIILRALAKKPEDRYPSIYAFAQALQNGTQHSSTLHATLSISQTEAQSGTHRAITLPGGRKVVVPVPPGAHEGQLLTLEGMGERHSPDTPPGALTLAITIAPAASSPVSTLSPAAFAPPTLPPVQTPAPGSFSTSQYSTNTSAPQGQSSQRQMGKVLLLFGLILLLIVVGSGVLSIASNHIFPSSAPATANGTGAAKGTATTLQSNGAAQQARATATFIANNPDPYGAPTGKLTLYDTLSNNNQGNNWDDVEGKNGSCHFINGAYVTRTSVANYSFFCTAEGTNFSNFACEVQMKIVQGNAGGLAFRVANANNAAFYYFRVDQDGSFALTVFQNHSGYFAATGTSTAIHKGLNQTNLLAVVANGTKLTLYVNRVLVKTVINTTYTHGQIGLVVNDITTTTEAIFSNMRVWKLS